MGKNGGDGKHVAWKKALRYENGSGEELQTDGFCNSVCAALGVICRTLRRTLRDGEVSSLQHGRESRKD